MCLSAAWKNRRLAEEEPQSILRGFPVTAGNSEEAEKQKREDGLVLSFLFSEDFHLVFRSRIWYDIHQSFNGRDPESVHGRQSGTALISATC